MTLIERPFSRFVTRTMDGIGRVLWAAETLYWSKTAPFAVAFPWKFGPYQEAIPSST
jgi:hypothetical protein